MLTWSLQYTALSKGSISLTFGLAELEWKQPGQGSTGDPQVYLVFLESCCEWRIRFLPSCMKKVNWRLIEGSRRVCRYARGFRWNAHHQGGCTNDPQVYWKFRRWCSCSLLWRWFALFVTLSQFSLSDFFSDYFLCRFFFLIDNFNFGFMAGLLKGFFLLLWFLDATF